jgi:hypothetical protein
MAASAEIWRRCLAELAVVLFALFFIAISFFPVSSSRRNDANEFIRKVAAGFSRVRNQQKNQTIHHSDGLPANFSIFNPVLLRESVWVIENLTRDFEGDAMLSVIRFRFCRIPTRNESCISITTIA